MSLFARIKDALKNARRRVEPIDPARFNDPLALTVEWTPAKGGGTNICSHRLEKKNTARLEFRARKMALWFPGIFMAAGLAFGSFMVFQGLAGDTPLLFIGPLFGLAFFTTGFVLFRRWSEPRVFDKKFGFYWQGKSCSQRREVREQKQFCALSEIHALQLLQEYCRSSSNNGSSSSYYSYELNLVCKNGKRINVIDHGDATALREDARTLSHFLGVPIWDATSA